MAETLDCLIVGAGPGGLVAATYLARYRRRIAVVDAGASRARWIPTSHNCPGFPLGVSGTTLLARLREQAEEHGVVVTHGRIESLAREPGAGTDGTACAFVARDAAGGEWRAATVILATGIVDALPEVEGGADALAAAIEAGTLRLCAICDGYEARDSRIAVLAPAGEAESHARFLRTFSRSVDTIHSDVPYRLDCDADRCRVQTVGAGEGEGAATREYDTLYPVLGGESQSQLAQALGAAVDDEGALRTDPHQQTSVPGLYAIGDVVSALNQIAVAVGHAAIAATAVHNRLPPNPRPG
ncbi:MAG: NAD(P)/FAD-dependent oxidoreductase [Luteimonas sp.]